MYHKFLFILATTVLLNAQEEPKPHKYFKIKVIDEETGRGVPLVFLTTTNHLQYVTDSNGIVAFYEPGLMNTDVYFEISSHGYEYPPNAMFKNYRGVTLKPIEGKTAEVKVKRTMVAQRMYRITGQGIYRDSLLVGEKTPTERSAINGLVMGSDSVLNTIYKGKINWFWGDTNKPSFPLGNFHVPGATSSLPKDGGLDPEKGIDLTYFTADKNNPNLFAKETCHVQAGKGGPTWCGGLLTLNDEKGKESMYAMYVKIEHPMSTYEAGIVKFNDEKETFEKLFAYDLSTPIQPGGHPFKLTLDKTEYIFFGSGTRVKADIKDYLDLKKYEAYTCLMEGSTINDPKIDKDDNGKVIYKWRANTRPIDVKGQAILVKNNKLKDSEALYYFRDMDSGHAVSNHGNTIYWNEFRNRWVMIMLQNYGSPSFLGEVWYAESDSPMGPWVYARKVLTHNAYSFYNVKHHPMFDKEKGKIIFFEGTYTISFSGNTHATARYDYNQIMYKLDLSDKRCAVPVPIYSLADGRFGTKENLKADDKSPAIALFACDREGINTIPIYLQKNKDGFHSLSLEKKNNTVIFYAVDAKTEKPHAGTTPLYEFKNGKGESIYTTDKKFEKVGFNAEKDPICLVWKNPSVLQYPIIQK